MDTEDPLEVPLLLALAGDGGITVAGCPLAPARLKRKNEEKQQQEKRNINKSGISQTITPYFLGAGRVTDCCAE